MSEHWSHNNLTDAVTNHLSNMGFSRNHIHRAFKIYQKHYGNSYNLSVLTEIIIRLQSKDHRKRHSVDHTHTHALSRIKHRNINTHEKQNNYPCNQRPSISYSNQSCQSCPNQIPAPQPLQPQKPYIEHKKRKHKTYLHGTLNSERVDRVDMVSSDDSVNSSNMLNEYNFNSDGDDDVDDIDIDNVDTDNNEIDEILHKEYVKIQNKTPKRKSAIVCGTLPLLEEKQESIHMKTYVQNKSNKSRHIKHGKKRKHSKNRLNRRHSDSVAIKSKIAKDEMDMDDQQMIDKIIGAKQYKLWDFDNERVNIYRCKCFHIKYENFVPKLYDIIYPTILSSMTLPLSLCNSSHKYKVNIVFSTQILAHLQLEKHCIIKTDFEFDLNSKTQHIIDIVLENIINDMENNDININIEWDNLYKTCFMLKVEDREEYLKYSDNYNVIDLNYVRECVRNDTINNMQFILLYSSELYNYSDYQFRVRVSNNNNKCKQRIITHARTTRNKAIQLKYENMGFNSILNTLHRLHKTKDGNAFDEIIKSVNDEMEWVANKIGSIKTLKEQQLILQIEEEKEEEKKEREYEYDELFEEKEEEKQRGEINYNLIEKEAILLSEFEHRIEISICEIVNIQSCPRYNAKEHYFLLFRMELMFGVNTFKEFTFDIRIPKPFINNKIILPFPQCNFYSNKRELNYSMLPRECVWNITIYAIAKEKKQENEMEKEIMNLEKKYTPKLIENVNTNSKQEKELKEQIVSSRNCKTNNNEFQSQYPPEPIAFCRVPLVNNKHCLNKGKKVIYLYQIPHESFDAHSTNNFGMTYPQSLKDRKKDYKQQLVSITMQFFFNKYKFDIVAPILNPRTMNDCKIDIEAQKKLGRKGDNILQDIIDNGIKSERDAILISSNKLSLMRDERRPFDALITYLLSINWTDQYERMQCYDIISSWTQWHCYEDFICLLKHNFMDNYIRLYAIAQLNKLDDFTLSKYLFQLIEILKYEINHQSFLSRFLMYRALQNPYQIGNYFFWCLKSQLFQNPFYYERFALLIEEYLSYSPTYIKHNIFKQHNLMNNLKIIAAKIRQIRHNNNKAEKILLNKEIKKLFTNELTVLNRKLFGYDEKNKKNKNKNGAAMKLIEFPLNPSIKIKRIKISKCSIPSNKIILLTFITNTNKYICAKFKYGTYHNLKSEILTSKLISIMDLLWLKNNLDLKIKTYSAIQTGSKTGLIEIISNSKQIKNDIFGINSIFANNSQSDIENINDEIEKQREIYARSCAGYCMATNMLGININVINCKNIHILNNGQLFYINFAHSLFTNNMYDINNIHKQPPFLFTNYMKFAIDQKSSLYQQFELWLLEAFRLCRQKCKLFENLLLFSDAPKYDLKYKLRFDLKNSNVKTRVHIQDTLNLCLTYKDNNKIL